MLRRDILYVTLCFCIINLFIILIVCNCQMKSITNYMFTPWYLWTCMCYFCLWMLDIYEHVCATCVYGCLIFMNMYVLLVSMDAWYLWTCMCYLCLWMLDIYEHVCVNVWSRPICICGILHFKLNGIDAINKISKPRII